MKYCRKCGSKMSEDAVFCSKCGCKFIEPEETDEIIKDTADKTEISSKTELYPEEYPTEEENTDMQLQNDLSARYSVEQNDINDNVPPLLKELSLMYEKIAKYSLATGIVEFLGAAVVILIGTAFIAQPERLLVPGIIFIIYGIGAAVTGLLNIIKFFKGNKFCKIIKSDPSQALEESLDIFMDENKYARLMKSTESLDTLNIFFRFYKDIKYAQKHEYIKAFIEENNKELSDIYSAYSAIDQGKEITDEMQKSLSSFPKTSYSNKLNLRIRTILTGICLIILIPVVIWLNKLMREPEYAKQVGEDLRAHSVTQQEGSVSEKETPSNITTPQQYTAEEFMDRYNELASNYGSVINSFDFSKATKGQEDGLLYFEILNDEHDKAIHLGTESNDYTGNIHWVNIQYLIPEGQDSIYPSEVANVITIFFPEMTFYDASQICEKAIGHEDFTDPSISGLILNYQKDEANNLELWSILMSDTDTNNTEISKSSETSSDNETSDNDYSSELEQLEQERINTLNELKTSADKMLHESYNKNDYEAVQQKEIESIINKYMEQINNATVANDVNKLYAAAINEINNVKTIQQLEEESARAVPAPEYYNETLYADKLFNYNGITYYTPAFSGKGDTGYLDFSFSALGNKYKALTLPDMYDSYGRQVNIDSFIIVGDVVYFTDQEAGSVSPLPAKLYMMNLDGSACTLIAEDVDVRFYCEGNIIYFASCYSSDDSYTYSISSGEKKYIGKRISLDNSDMIFYSNDRVEYNGGIYYKENLVYYREDKATGSVQVVGHSVGGGQQ